MVGKAWDENVHRMATQQLTKYLTPIDKKETDMNSEVLDSLDRAILDLADSPIFGSNDKAMLSRLREILPVLLSMQKAIDNQTTHFTEVLRKEMTKLSLEDMEWEEISEHIFDNYRDEFAEAAVAAIRDGILTNLGR